MLDKVRDVFIYSDIALKGFAKKLKDHEDGSMLNSYSSRCVNLNICYPNGNSQQLDNISSSLIKGRFNDLKMVQGIPFTADKEEEICALFQWNDFERNNLSKLSIPFGNHEMQKKKIRHIMSLCTLACNLCLDPNKSMVMLSGCEWQLNL